MMYVKSVTVSVRNGKLQAQVPVQGGPWSNCTSNQMMLIFNQLYHFLKSTSVSETICGIDTEKKYIKVGKGVKLATCNLDFKIMHLRAKEAIEKSSRKVASHIVVTISLPFEYADYGDEQ